MPRTAITPQAVVVTGLALATEPANVDGNSIQLGPGRALFVNNASAASINVIFPTTAVLEGLTVGNRVVAVPNGAARYLRLSSTAAQPGGVVHADYSAVPGVTVAVLEV